LLVDAAFVAIEELAAVFDDQFVWAVQGKMEAGGTQGLKPPVLVPGEIHVWE